MAKNKKYTSVENSDGTTTNTFEKKRKLGKNKGEVKKRVTSKVKKNKSGETRGLASVTQKYNKKGELKKEKGSGNNTELASLRESVKKNDKIASPATKRANLGGKPKKMRTSNMSKANLILNTPNNVFKPIVAKTDYDYKFEKEGPMPNMAAQMKNKAMTADAKAAQMKFDSSTFEGIESLYTGGRVGGQVGQESQKSNTAPDLMRDVNRIKQRVKPSNFHTSGSPEFLTSAESGERLNTTTGGIDEGNFGPITTNIPEKSKVTAIEGSSNYEPGEEFYINPTKMSGKHPSQMRMGSMVQKVATYKMPNVKAAQKKNYKY
tara:strand:- start:1675 stop:2634 length:960 start_codon:yes stop_codon:yes gene_type:complete